MVAMYPTMTINTKSSLTDLAEVNGFKRGFMLSLFLDTDISSTLCQGWARDQFQLRGRTESLVCRSGADTCFAPGVRRVTLH
jgi:hypothetical protein